MNLPRLFLYSMNLSEEQLSVLARMVGRSSGQVTVAVIENAADVVPPLQEWLGNFRAVLSNAGFALERVDLRKWLNGESGLYEKLATKDIIWLGGGNTYYLRWILKASGADKMIEQLVNEGKIYAGWSAGGIVAGPTLAHFHLLGDDPKDAPEVVMEGLRFTDIVMVPHKNHAMFADGVVKASALLEEAGYTTQVLNDDQVLVVEGNDVCII